MGVEQIDLNLIWFCAWITSACMTPGAAAAVAAVVATRPDPAHVAPFLINRLAEARILSLALSLEQKSTFHDKCARVLQWNKGI